MRSRIAHTILLLYPRQVRTVHGPEITALIDDLITHDGRSAAGLLARLAADGLIQRIASTATIWTLTVVLTATGFGGLVLSDFAAASAHQRPPRTSRSMTPAEHNHRASHLPIHSSYRAAARPDRPTGSPPGRSGTWQMAARPIAP